MLGLGGVTGSTWDLLSALQSRHPANSAAAGGAGAGQFAANGTDGQATPTSAPPLAPNAQNPLSPNVLGFLIWNQSQQSAGTTAATAPAGSGTLTPPQSALFSRLDADGDGAISQSEFTTAFGANGNTAAAGALFSKIDTNGDGSIDPGELAAATPGSGSRGHRHHHHGGFAGLSQSGGSDPLANLLGASSQGASSTSATNADGSSTTTITYADGSKVTLTIPAQAASGPQATTPAAPQPPAASSNILETLIQLQAQLLGSTAKA